MDELHRLPIHLHPLDLKKSREFENQHPRSILAYLKLQASVRMDFFRRLYRGRDHIAMHGHPIPVPFFNALRLRHTRFSSVERLLARKRSPDVVVSAPTLGRARLPRLHLFSRHRIKVNVENTPLSPQKPGVQDSVTRSCK